MLSILNGDDRPFTLATLDKCIAKRKGTKSAHLRAVKRSLNPAAARSRASKGASAMAKHHKKAAHKKRRRNPTYEGNLRQIGASSSPRRSGVKARVASASRRAVSNLKGLDLMGLLKEGAGVGIGMLASSFVEKQADKFLPSFVPAAAKPVVASAIVAGAAIAFGGSKGFTRGIAVGAIGEAIRGVGRTFAPSLFAGTDDGGAATGYWDPQTGQWVSADGQVAGVTYDPSLPLPTDYSVRPAGF